MIVFALEVKKQVHPASTPDERVPVTEDLAAELEELATALGHPGFRAWVGTENYEMRVASDGSWIDVRVLETIRGTRPWRSAAAG